MSRAPSACLLAFLSFLSCGPMSRSRPRVPTTCAPDEPVLETLTVNWGVAPGVVDLATPRIPAIAEEVVKMRGVDVLCFQELWTEESKKAVVEALGPDMYTYWVETRGENERPGIDVCTPGEIGDVAACGRTHCSGLPDEEQTNCAREKCLEELGWMYIRGDRECFNCVAAGVGHSIDDIVKRCVQPDVSSTVQGASRAYDGQTGALLASAWPLKDVEVMRLRASFSNRVALFATIEEPSFGPVEVACAHISTETPLPPNHPEFSDWNEEMIAQVEDISARLAERAKGRPQLFMADLNAGPEIRLADVSPAMPRVWSRTMSLGFWSPAASSEDPFCSTCAENTLRDSLHSYLIDHVLLRDPPGGVELEAACAHPYLDQRRVFRGYDGRWVDEHLSDHFGVSVKFRLKKR